MKQLFRYFGRQLKITTLAVGVLIMAAVPPSRVVAISNCAEAVPLAVHCENYLRENQFAPVHTVRAKRIDLRHYMTFLSALLEQPYERIMFYDATTSAIRAFGDYRYKVESRSSCARRLATVKHLHRWVSEKFGAHDSARSVVAPGVKVSNFRGLSDLQRAKLYAAIQTASARDRFIVQLIRATGLRRFEAASLTLGQISDDWRYYTNIQGKGRRVRNVPITVTHRRELMSYLHFRQVAPTLPSFPLLISEHTGAQKRPETWTLSADRVGKIVKQFGVNAHALRHDFAQRYLKKRSLEVGASQAFNELRVLLGHASISTTQEYTIPHQDELYLAMENFI